MVNLNPVGDEMLKKVVILIWSVLAMLMMLTSMVTATVWLVGHETLRR